MGGHSPLFKAIGKNAVKRFFVPGPPLFPPREGHPAAASKYRAAAPRMAMFSVSETAIFSRSLAIE
jgi:hypothetical protein